MSRMQDITSALLHQLADWDEPVDEAVLHAAINNRLNPAPMISEFADALRICEGSRLITGTRNLLRGPRWSLTDKGRAQRHA